MTSVVISVEGSVAHMLPRETTRLTRYRGYTMETTQSPDRIMLAGNANHILEIFYSD